MDSVCEIRNLHEISQFRGDVVVVQTGYKAPAVFGTAKSQLIEDGIVTYVPKAVIYNYTPRQYDLPSAYTLCSANWGEGIMKRLDQTALREYPKFQVRSLTDKEIKSLNEELAKPDTTYKFADYDSCMGADRLARTFLKNMAAKEE